MSTIESYRSRALWCGETEKVHLEGISKKSGSTSEGQEDEEGLRNKAEGARGPEKTTRIQHKLENWWPAGQI